MTNNRVRKMVFAALLCAIAVVGSMISFPVLGSRCAPVQHMVNIICAVALGPFYGVGVAFAASLLRNLLGLGSLLAFPGSMCGALLCGLLFYKMKNMTVASLGEVFGTAVIGGLAAYPIAIAYMGQAGQITVVTYIVPFLISTAAGAILANIVVRALRKQLKLIAG